jgi:NAD-dependent deacetylase
MQNAYSLTSQAEIFVTIGTSLSVYPAASLIEYVDEDVPKYLVDPGAFNLGYIPNFLHIAETATNGVKILEKELKKFF